MRFLVGSGRLGLVAHHPFISAISDESSLPLYPCPPPAVNPRFFLSKNFFFYGFPGINRYGNIKTAISSPPGTFPLSDSLDPTFSPAGIFSFVTTRGPEGTVQTPCPQSVAPHWFRDGEALFLRVWCVSSAFCPKLFSLERSSLISLLAISDASEGKSR